MARIVLATLGTFGDLNPYIALALALRSRGHSAVIATSEVYRDRVEAVGLPLHPVRPNLTEAEMLSQVRLTGDPNRDGEALLRDLLFPQLRASYEDLYGLACDADMLVTHVLVFAAPLVASKTGIPWVSCVLSPRSFLSAHEPSAVTVGGTARLMYLSPQENRAALDVAKRVTAACAEPVERLRQEQSVACDAIEQVLRHPLRTPWQITESAAGSGSPHQADVSENDPDQLGEKWK